MKLRTKIMAIVSLLVTTSIAIAGSDKNNHELTDTDIYTLLSVGTPGSSHFGGYIQLGSEATIDGNIGSRVNYQLGSNVVIDGNVDGGTPVSISPSAMVYGSYDVKPDAYWSQIYNELSDASSVAAAYSGTNLGSINSSQIFYASSKGISVFNINGSINLGGYDSITLIGDANDTFIINVSGNLTLGSGTAILLEGVEADQVLFNFTGGGFTNTATIGAAILSGTYLAPDMYWQIGDGATMNATNIWASGIQGNIQTIYGTGLSADLVKRIFFEAN
ncbi:MAG: hypothetical protein V3V18_03615 [Methylococcales bacterium]